MSFKFQKKLDKFLKIVNVSLKDNNSSSLPILTSVNKSTKL